jgi:hypothetical protein
MFKLDAVKLSPVIRVLALAAAAAAAAGETAKAERIEDLVQEWIDPNAGYAKTLAAGKKLEAALVDSIGSWWRTAGEVIATANVPETLKNEATETVESVQEAVAPTKPKPTLEYGEPLPPPPEIIWETPVDHVPSAGDVYLRVKRVQQSTTRGPVADISQLKYMHPDKGGHRMYNTANSKEEVIVSDEDLKSNYQLVVVADWWNPEMGGRRKTRRGRGKKRRTVKRRAKSLRRRRQ